MKLVLVTGGFDPLHSGHIEYFKEAKKLGDKLIVGLNSDEWLTRKKGRPFMPFQERLALIKEMAIVDDVMSFDDSDNSACGAIYKTLATNGSAHIIFANGGDRTDSNIPEMTTYADAHNVEFVFGVGGNNKMNSSSWILDEWKTQKTERQWGYWRVLDHKPEKGYKVKELVIYPGKSLSNQKHFKRSEQWSILEGQVQMDTEFNNVQSSLILQPESRPYGIDIGVWHQASNPGTENAHILEIQRGTECVEEDIERK
jgi:D-beta-D-heptose 7-phosphate kinase/D-beta-D-heptose 1-phosphate adenosyltransferase